MADVDVVVIGAGSGGASLAALVGRAAPRPVSRGVRRRWSRRGTHLAVDSGFGVAARVDANLGRV